MNGEKIEALKVMLEAEYFNIASEFYFEGKSYDAYSDNLASNKEYLDDRYSFVNSIISKIKLVEKAE